MAPYSRALVTTGRSEIPRGGFQVETIAPSRLPLDQSALFYFVDRWSCSTAALGILGDRSLLTEKDYE
jgi:hypothetical protein